MAQVERIVSKQLRVNKQHMFSEISMFSEYMKFLSKNGELLSQLMKQKMRQNMNYAFGCIQRINESKSSRIDRGLAILSGMGYSKHGEHMVSFMNELEMLSLAYELIFRRMLHLQWKSEPKFYSFFHLARSYIKALWLKYPQKYEYSHDLVEDRPQIYFIVLEELLSNLFDSRRIIMFRSFFQRFNEAKAWKNKAALKIVACGETVRKRNLRTYFRKFLITVNKIQPEYQLPHLLKQIFESSVALNKKVAFTEIKALSMEAGLRKRNLFLGLKILAGLVNGSKQKTTLSLEYRILFPIKDYSYRESGLWRLHGLIKSKERKSVRWAARRLKDFSIEALYQKLQSGALDDQTKNFGVRSAQSEAIFRLSNLLQKQIARTTGSGLRMIQLSLKSDQTERKAWKILHRLVTRRQMEAFSWLMEYYFSLKGLRLNELRLGLNCLDQIFKNKLNEGSFSMTDRIQSGEEHHNGTGDPEGPGCN